MTSEHCISVIIPNRNGGRTIKKCLEAAFASHYPHFEVIVVDDCSTDNSVDIINRFPCRLIRLESHAGASAARNAGARSGRGECLFFIDADCVLMQDTLSRVNETFNEHENAVIGGTYTPLPYDSGFFSAFQSVFIHYSETKRRSPDYIATHALAIHSELFRRNSGFAEDFLPILEDVEFSHRLREQGARLIMEPRIQVRHIFNFTLVRSLGNAFRKSRYWTVYSLGTGDLFADSGTASHELKANGVSFLAASGLLLSSLLSSSPWFLFPLPFLLAANLWINRGLLAAFAAAGGPLFPARAALYYLTLYPAAVLAGACAGIFRHLGTPFRKRGART